MVLTIPRDTPSNIVNSPNRIKFIGTCLNRKFHHFIIFLSFLKLYLHSEGFDTNHGDHDHHRKPCRAPHHPHVTDGKPSEEKFSVSRIQVISLLYLHFVGSLNQVLVSILEWAGVVLILPHLFIIVVAVLVILDFCLRTKQPQVD